MEHGSELKPSTSKITFEDYDAGSSALNSTILDYYKKFGRKRDLEQYFSLSTVQGEVSDTSSLFWRKLKMSDSDGENKCESPVEICKISITCTQPEDDSSTEEIMKSQKSESPPIVTDEATPFMMQQTDADSVKSDDNGSPKSLDRTFDTSINKPNSPTSSITSQRKLEWDSLADVGYANENERKNSASSLSTIERLALHQQYSNSDPQLNIGQPTAQSTPQDEVDNRSRIKNSKTTKIHRKDVDVVEVKTSDHNPAPTVNVNLTKHISFNVDKSGEVSIGVAKQDISYGEDKMDDNPFKREDKEIQTTLTKQNDKTGKDQKQPKSYPLYGNAIPVLINVNTIKKRRKLNRLKAHRKKLRSKKKVSVEKVNVTLEKSGDQVSAAESFEYMPGDVYNQNQHMNDLPSTSNAAGNKSSLESSRGATTTDSSKEESKKSFSADLEKNINFLKVAMHKHFANYEIKKALIKNIVQDLVKSNYKEDSTTDFLSGLSFSSKHLGLSHHSTSTSDTGKKLRKPKKSILRDTRSQNNSSQSVPNLRSTIKNNESMSEPKDISTSDTDASKKAKNTSQIDSSKLSSEELYCQYIEALQREKARKKYLKDKELFMRQKLTKSVSTPEMPSNIDKKVEAKLKSLMYDLIRNNYNDGSGDASKIESSEGFPLNINKNSRDQKSRSIFTTSSSNCDGIQASPRNDNIVNPILADQKPLTSHYCCCPYHFDNVPYVCEASYDEKDKVTDNAEQKMAKAQCRVKDCTYKPTQNMNNNDSPAYVKKCSCLKGKPLQLQEQYSNEHVSGGNEVIKSQDLLPNSARSVKSQHDNIITTHNVQSKSKDVSDKIAKSCQTNIKLKIVSENIENSMSTVPLDRSILDNGLIREATRSVQTELSINPKKTEPTLNDIKIINENDCVTLIMENFRPLTNTRKYFKSVQGTISSENLFTEVTKEKNVKESTIPLSIEVTASSTIQRELDSGFSVFSIDKCSKAVQSDNISISMGLNVQSANDFESRNQQQHEMKKISTTLKDNLVRIQDSNSNVKEQPESEANISDSKQVSEQQTSDHTSKDSCLIIKNPEKPNKSDRSQCRCGISSCIGQCVQEVFSKAELKSSCSGKNFLESTEYFGSSQASSNKTKVIQRVTRCNTDTGNFFKKKEIVKDIKQSKTLPFKIRDDMEKQSSSMMSFLSNPMTDSVHKDQFNNNLKGKEQCNDLEKKYTEVYYKNLVEPKTNSDKNIGKSDVEKNHCISKNYPEYGSDTSADLSRKSHSYDKPASSEESNSCKEILSIIQDVTKRYTKKNIKKNQKKKCFKEIIKLLGYLLDTEDTQEDTKNATDDSKRSMNSSLESFETLCSSLKKYEKNKYDTKFHIQSKNSGPVNKENRNYQTKTASKSTETQDGVCNTERTKDTEVQCKDSSTLSRDCEQTDKRNVQCSTEEETSKQPSKDIPRGKTLVDKGIQISKKPSSRYMASSETPMSSEIPTSSDTATCKIFNKIKRECENYHRRRCSSHGIKRCECSSTTLVNCEHCKCKHYCNCRIKYRSHRSSHVEPTTEQNKCVAYNLILKSSESMTLDESFCNTINKPLRNIVVKVPTKRSLTKIPFKEISAKIENQITDSPRINNLPKPKDFDENCKLNNENTTLQTYSIREYLEKNRPDFVAECMKRQEYLKLNNQKRDEEASGDRQRPRVLLVVDKADLDNPCTLFCGVTSKCAAQRQVLSMQLQTQSTALTEIDEDDLRELVRHIGVDSPSRRAQFERKLMSEREMKKHSEQIYMTLPEVTKKKEDARKESIKRTNLLMAYIFKKNLQKKALSGSVNLSNYSKIIKI